MNFKFPVEVNAPKGLTGWLMRWHARKVAHMIAVLPFQTYQFGGVQGELTEYLLIDADKYQVIHWVLTTAGYYCTTAQVMERCGVEFKAKPTPEGTLTVFSETQKTMMEWIRHSKVPWLKL